MIRHSCTYLCLGTALFFVAGCQTMTYKIDPEKGTMLGKPPVSSVGFVEKSTTAHYMFWGLLPVSTPDINELAARAGVGTDLVLADIRIIEKNTFLDGLLALITYGIYRPRSVEITGKLYNKGGLTYVQ